MMLLLIFGRDYCASFYLFGVIFVRLNRRLYRQFHINLGLENFVFQLEALGAAGLGLLETLG